MKSDKVVLERICDSFLDNVIELHDIPGLAIGVSRGDAIYTGARGYRNFITKEKMNSDNIFHCGSVSKIFTSMSIMKLSEEGALSIEDKLCQLLPDLDIDDRRWKEIKIYQMLSHTSGLGDVDDYCWNKPRLDDGALRAYVYSQYVKELPMLWAPGEGGFRYSNVAYEVLGAIIEKVSGMTFEKYVEENFLKPTGMTDSTFLTYERTGGSLKLEDIDRAQMAMPHTKDEKKNIVMEKHYPYNREHGPSSTLTSNVADLIKWGRANLKRGMLKEETYDKIWREYSIVPNNGEIMGLGWFLREQERCRLVGHEGTDDGFRASFWICPEKDAVIAVLCNITKAPVKRINKELFKILSRESII